MKKRVINLHRSVVRERMSRVPEDSLIAYMRSLIFSTPQIRPKSFIPGKIMPEVTGSFTSYRLKTLIVIRNLRESIEESTKVARRLKDLRDEGWLCICVFPQTLKYGRAQLQEKLKYEIFAHIKASNLW